MNKTVINAELVNHATEGYYLVLSEANLYINYEKDGSYSIDIYDEGCPVIEKLRCDEFVEAVLRKTEVI